MSLATGFRKTNKGLGVAVVVFKFDDFAVGDEEECGEMANAKAEREEAVG